MTVLAFDPSNRATLTTLDKNNTRLTGNHAGAYQMARSNASIKNGQKRYWHYIMDAGDGSENWTTFTALNGTRTVGVVNGTQGFASGQFPGISTNSYGWYGVNGNKYYNNALDAASPPALGTAFSSYAHSMFSVAVDRVANKAYIGIGPIWRATFDPIAGTNGYAIEVAGTDDHYAAAAVFTGGNRVQLSTWPRLQLLEDIGYLPLGFELVDVTIPALEPNKTFTLSPGTLATSRLIRYSIFAGTGILAAPIATGTFTTDGSALMPAVQIQTDSDATEGWMVWHVDGSGPGFGGVRPVTLAVAA